ncbi:Calycin [Gracilaria domingensis]|nr:Calycin [Gracilaria domingensis]
MAFIHHIPVLHRPRTLVGVPSRRISFASSRRPHAARVRMVAEPASRAPFSAVGMSVDEFFKRSMGVWRSQRSSHILAFAQFEAITSEICIEQIGIDDQRTKDLASLHNVSVDEIAIAIYMSWEGESDWDDDTEGDLSGHTVLAVTKDTDNSGRLLRNTGYAETIPAIGEWRMTDEGVFVLETPYEAAAAEERIWFATKDLRMRVSQIRTSSGAGVVSASLSTEIRRLNM